MQLEKRGRGRPATGLTTTVIRVPIALKPAVVALVNTFHLAEQKAWEAGPLRRQPEPQPDQAIEPGSPEHYSRGLRAWLEDESIKPNQDPNYDRHDL